MVARNINGRRLRWLLVAATILAPFLIPDSAIIPVKGATTKDWNHKSFWFEPWGKSGVHKGIDIFAKEGRPVTSATRGVLLYQGTLGIGGNVVVILGPRWRIHYYAHLQGRGTSSLFVRQGKEIGHVGTSGNAMGKPPHLHYSIVSIIPYPWLIDRSPQGWKKAFFINPQDVISVT